MPTLTWDSKKQPQPIATKYCVDSLIYPQGVGYPDTLQQNRIILGDNLALMWALLEHYENKTNLIYIDPPFFTNKKYRARIGRGEDSRRPNEWKMAEGYGDHWRSLDDYLEFLYHRFVLIYRLLAPNGTLYFHLDWHANSYARVLLDEIFGYDRLINEIIWVYHGPSPIRSAFNRKHDTILVYTKSKNYTFNVDDVREPYHPTTLKTFKSSPKAGFGKVPDLKRGKVPEDWWYFPVVARLHGERTGYPTQKPQALLERIIKASSNPGDLVADFFSGSGTTAAVAARLARRFIVSDISWRAVHTTRLRVLDSPGAVTRLEHDVAVENQMMTNEKYLPVHFEAVNRVVSIPFFDDLIFWEVDPDWDGQVFRSAAQAARPLRKGKIPLQLTLPFVGAKICVRFVNLDGDCSEVVLPGIAGD